MYKRQVYGLFIVFYLVGTTLPFDGPWRERILELLGDVYKRQVLILIIWWNGRRGFFTPERHWGVEATAIYWHYVDVVWVFFYPALYLMGQVAG